MGVLDRYLCPLAALAEQLGPLALVAILSGIAGGGLFGVSLVRLLRRWVWKGGGGLGAGWLAAVLIAMALYVLGLVLDPLLMATIDRPAGVGAEAWARVGFFEWKLLGPWGAPILPLSAHPATGIAVHCVFWPAIIALIRAILLWIHRDFNPTWATPEHAVPWYYRWVGSSNARRADHRFRRWAGRVLPFAILAHLTCGYLLASEAAHAAPPAVPSCDPGAIAGAAAAAIAGPSIAGAPWPGAWVLFGLFFFALSVRLLFEGQPPDEEKQQAQEEETTEAAPPPDPLPRLGQALSQAVGGGAYLDALEQRPEVLGETKEFAASTSPLVKEAFQALTEAQAPWTHQREVLDHLDEVWRMASPLGPGAAPELKEEAAPSPIRERALSTPHALVLAPEGSGRSTTTFLAALHVHLDRGATTLALLHDRDAARGWAARLTDVLARSSARWNVHVAVAGEDASDAFLSGRAPAIVAAGLTDCEGELLGLDRSDPFFRKLGLIVLDDVDRFTGLSEMHLHLVMRRIWTLLDTLHDAPYPPVLLAVAGPSASGMEAWAQHVLAAPMRVFDADTAPRPLQAILRRRDLADSAGEAIPLQKVIEACDRAQIPWHHRRAGDALRHTPRAETELGSLRRHHAPDPLDAEVVLLEGTYPDVRREADRLAHAGRRNGRGSAVLVLAPPGDEEMVLHEEAADAAHRGLVSALPRAIPLAEPDVLRQRHFERALGREQDLAALRLRFGEDLVDPVLARLEEKRRVRQREVWVFDPRTDDAVPRRLVRAAGEASLGEPIHPGCVGDSTTRAPILDRGSRETLLEVDRALAPILHPPGSVFVHARGRYQIVELREDAVLATPLVEPQRTTIERELLVELEAPAWSPRELGGEPIEVCVGSTQLTETSLGVRRYAPGPKLVEERKLATPVTASYRTSVCAIDLSDIDTTHSRIPLAAAVRMMLCCYARGADDGVDVGLADVGGRPSLVLFDRTPGGSGYTSGIAEAGLTELFVLARLVLERLVGPEAARLRAIHDTTHGVRASEWRTAEALAWLDRILDPSAGREDAQEQQSTRGRRVVHVAGEGKGDLGRLWISNTGRSDDLVWTRHRWRSAFAIGEQPAGMVHLDIAVERRAIAHAIRRAGMAGASTTPIEIKDAGTWSAQHQAAIATAAVDLIPIAQQLMRIAGARYTDVVLGLVGAIPTYAGKLAPVERAPLAVLARRKADAGAKALLAWSLLPRQTKAELRWTERGTVLQLVRDGAVEIVDLSGDAIRTFEGDSGEALAVRWDAVAPAAQAATGEVVEGEAVEER